MALSVLGRRLGVALAGVAVTALGATESGAQGRGFDGTWTVTRSFTVGQTGQGCSAIGSDFRIRIQAGVVRAPGGRGSVSTSGAIRFPGTANYFRGTLSGNSGSGTFVGQCSGTFRAVRR